MSRPAKWVALSNPTGGDALFDLFRRLVKGRGALPAALLIPTTYRWLPNMPTLPRPAGEPETLYGIEVIRSAVLPKVPAVAIDRDFPWITDEGRRRINARFLELFGEVDAAFVLSHDQVRALRNDWTGRIDADIEAAFDGGYR